MNPAWLLLPALLYPLFEAAHIKLRRWELVCERLPAAWDGVRILYLSDSHIRRRGRRERNLERLLDGVETDLLIFGGDIASDLRGYRVMIRVAERVIVRLGRFATWGNGESLKKFPYDAVVETLAEAGYSTLENANVTLDREGRALAICAVACPYSNRDDIPAAFRGVPDDAFRILLMHAPEGLIRLGGHRADLIVSGHTHGGQIRIPGLRAIDLHTKTEVDLDRGLFMGARLRPFWPDAPDGARMVVGAGIGTSTAPVRLFCPPEALLLTLRSLPRANPTPPAPP